MLCHNPFDFKGFAAMTPPRSKTHLAAILATWLVAVLTLSATPARAQADGNFTRQPTLGGGNTPGESTAKPGATYVPPTSPAPRQPNGKVDFSGVWDHAYVPDMARTSANNPVLQTGPGDLPYSADGLKNIQAYDPERDGDYTGMCMPFGFTRSMNSPYPIQIFQNDAFVAFLFEQNSWFHVVPFRAAHSAELEPTWFGSSIAKWDGDTLVVVTRGFNGFTRLDTKGNPHSDRMTLTQRFTRTDKGHIAYEATIDDPVYYTKPWTNTRTFTLSSGNLMEYSCEENNRSMWEGRIKLWIPPSAGPPRPPRPN
jgi:hypothetical protein